MLGRDLARELKAEVGRSLTLLSTTADGGLNAQDVRVAGVFSTGIPELDKRLLLTGLGTVQALLRTDRVSSLAVYLHHTDDTAAVREALGRDLPGYALRPWWMEAHFYSSVRALYERIFGVLGVIVALMVFFSVANTMGMTVIERTREIGALRALGAAPGDIVRNFTLEALVIGVGGALIGVLLAAGLSSLLAIANIQMPPPPGRSSGYPLLVHILPGQYVIRTVTVAALCIVAAWLASHRAARKPIVEALAHV
jgi:putative ABC transport system permease protein